MTGTGHFRRLALCLTASAVLLFYAHQIKLDAPTAVLLGCGPLALYHIYLARKARSGLSQAEIDSVYFFGFLVTIIAMAIGAYDIGSATPDKNAIVRQFGVGILATAYAVLARMHLASLVSQAETGDPSTLLEQQLSRSMQVLDHMLDASAQASALAATLGSARKQIDEHSVDEARKVLQTVAHEFGTEMRSALQDTSVLAARLRQDLDVFRAATVGSGMADALLGIVQTAKVLHLNVEAAGNASLEAATGISMVAVELRGVGVALASIRRDMGTLSELHAHLTGLDSAAAAATQTVQGVTSDLHQAMSDLGEVAGQIAIAPRTMKRLADQVQRVSEGLDFLASVAAKVNSAAFGLGATADATERLRDAVSSVVAASPHISVGLSEMAGEMTRATASASELGGALATASSAASAFGSLGAGLSSGATAAESLGNSVATILPVLAAFSKQVEAIEAQLSVASSQLSGSTHDAAVSIERDLLKSTAAAAQLTDRLAHIVDTIIEQTTRRQGVRS